MPPTRPPRPLEPGGSPVAGLHSRPGWLSRYRNASDTLLACNCHRRCAWIFHPSLEDHVDAVGDDQRVGHDQGPGKLADAEVAYGLDTCPQDLGRDADGQPVAQERGDQTRSSFEHNTVAPRARTFSRLAAGALSVTARTVPGAASSVRTAAASGARRVLSTTTRSGF